MAEDGKAYCALVVDMRGSRKLGADRREAAQRQVLAAIDFLNYLYRFQLVKQVEFSAGDEVQGLFRDLSGAVLCYRSLAMFVDKADMRGGIGCGGWEVRMDGEGSTAQDGTAYHAAREAIGMAEWVRKYDLVIRTSPSYGGGRRGDSVDNELTVRCDHFLSIMDMRTKSQRAKAMLIELLAPVSMLLSVSDPLGDSEYSRDYLHRVLELLDRYVSTLDPGDAALKVIEPVLRGDAFWEYAPHFHRYVMGDVYDYEDAFLSGRMQGITYLLSRLLGISRNSLDKQLSKARLVQERNAVLSLCRMLGRQ